MGSKDLRKKSCQNIYIKNRNSPRTEQLQATLLRNVILQHCIVHPYCIGISRDYYMQMRTCTYTTEEISFMLRLIAKIIRAGFLLNEHDLNILLHNNSVHMIFWFKKKLKRSIERKKDISGSVDKAVTLGCQIMTAKTMTMNIFCPFHF